MSGRPEKLPGLVSWILRKVLPAEDRTYLQGDCLEIYTRIHGERGKIAADLWIWRQVAKAVPLHLSEAFLWRAVLFRNSIKIALRNIERFKLYSAIKVLGLALGIAACLLIHLFLADELSFDRFHKNRARLFRVVNIHFDQSSGKETGREPFLPPPMGPELRRYMPGIQNQTRFTNGSAVLRYGEKIFMETVWLADSSFFEMFSFPLLKGSPKTALPDLHSLVITRSIVEKYFGDEDPMGKTITLSFGRHSRDFTVTGVAGDVPPNSTLQFEVLIHMENLPEVWDAPDVFAQWNRWAFPLFVELRPDYEADQAERDMAGFRRMYFSEMLRRYLDKGHDPFRFGLQNIGEMHLDTRVTGNTGLRSASLLAAISAVILLIACVNFTNLSIGASSVRSREVGIRKVLGANRGRIRRQFLGEAVLMSLMAAGLGILLAGLFLSRFNVLSGKQLSLTMAFSGYHGAVLLGITVFTGLCAGSYPALIISAFHPADILRGRLKIGGFSVLTKGLVMFQFALSVILVIAAVELGRQVSFMRNKNPGYASRSLIEVLSQENQQAPSERLFERFQNRIVSHVKVLGVTASNREFGLFLPSSMLELGERKIPYFFNRVGPDFLTTMGLELLEGRDFLRNTQADDEAIIVNQRLVEQLGPDFRWDGFLGDASKGFPYNKRIVGVIKDCHFRSLRSRIEPLLLYVGRGESPRRNRFSRFFVRVEADSLNETMKDLEKAWRDIQPDKPFIAAIMGDTLSGLYDRENRWSMILRSASFFSVLLACLGVFGLTALTLERREKEIGIRKVLGAGMERIFYMAVKDFVFLIFLANGIAWPAAYFIVRKVLENYPYRIYPGWASFLLTGLASILITALTILSISIKAARADPAAALKYE